MSNTDRRQANRRRFLKLSGSVGTLLLGGSAAATRAVSDETLPTNQSRDRASYQPPIPARVVTEFGTSSDVVGIFGNSRTVTVADGDSLTVETSSRPPVQTFQVWFKPDLNSPTATFDYLSAQGNHPGYRVQLDTTADAVDLIEIDRNGRRSKTTDNHLDGSFTTNEWHRINVGIAKDRSVVRVYGSDETLMTVSKMTTHSPPAQLARTDVTFGATGGSVVFTEVVSNSVVADLHQLTQRHGDVVGRHQSASESDVKGVQASMEFNVKFEDGTQKMYEGTLLESGTLTFDADGEEYLGVVTDRQIEQTKTSLENVKNDLRDGSD